jgi:O-antigen/teichoic acid export membrane protein
MSRLKKYAASLFSGQIALTVNIVYTLVSVPLALHYLDKAEFGVWAVVLQVTGYLALVDAGMNFSFARLLIDHKDAREDGKYGAMVKLAFIFSSIQGLLILLLGFGLALIINLFIEIPVALQQKFQYLLIGQCALTMGVFFLKVFGQILYAHQRMDVTNYVGAAQLGLSLVLLAVFFYYGAGIYAMLYANMLAFLLCAFVPMLVCFKWNYLPGRHEYGRVSLELAREPLRYGLNLFFIVLGNQLTLASQTLIVGGTMGMEAAAVWSVMTKPFNFVSQIVWRIMDSATPALGEMWARGETLRFQKSFKGIVILTGCAAAVCAAGLAVCNAGFVKIWTAGQVGWTWYDNVLLGIWFLAISIYRCHCYLALITKEIRGMRYVFLIEGAVFIVMALCFSKHLQFSVILLFSIATSTCFSGIYGWVRTAGYFQAKKTEIMAWNAKVPGCLGLLVGIGWLVYYMLDGTFPILQLLGAGGILSLVGAVVVIKFGLPIETREMFIKKGSWLHGLLQSFLVPR